MITPQCRQRIEGLQPRRRPVNEGLHLERGRGNRKSRRAGANDNLGPIGCCELASGPRGKVRALFEALLARHFTMLYCHNLLQGAF
jgi:hypothetical protein